MNFKDLIRAAGEGILHRKMRSGLTILGVMIGIAAVVNTVGIGQGAQRDIAAEINKLGSNLLIVTPGSTKNAAGMEGGYGSATTLTMTDAQTLADPKVAPDVAAVAPVASTSTTARTADANWSTVAIGTTTAWLEVRSRELSTGRFFTAAEQQNGAKVVVLGQKTVQELKLDQPVGKSIFLGDTKVTIIGVLKTIGSASGNTEDDLVLMPTSTYTDHLAKKPMTALTKIYVKAKNKDVLHLAYQETHQALLTNHGVASESADFTINSQQSLVSAATKTSKTLTVLLGSIAAISLLVGGIGVMNIMLVNVAERTREIGLRKALGAKPADIQWQFLVEAGFLGLAGGFAGLLIGGIGVAVLPGLINQPVVMSYSAALIALSVSLVVGVIAGVYPAVRAARLAPINALRSIT